LSVVVDASVAAQWVVLQEHTTTARMLLQSRHELVAVDLIRVEVFNTLLRAIRTKRLDLAAAKLSVQFFERVPLRLQPTSAYASEAFDIARQQSGSVYDACYIALARSLDAPLATGDERMATVAETLGVRVHRLATGFAALLD
jgi:predicted nucleic acid-binding protein